MKTYWQKIKGIVGPAYSKDFDKTGQQNTRSAIEKYITSVSDKHTRLLDAGCNTGIEGYRLLQNNFLGKYIGVDSNSKAIKMARENLKTDKKYEFFTQDLSDLKFSDEYFDIVLSKDVIEHHKYYEAIIHELTRVTKKYLILSMFIRPSIFFKDKIILHSDGYYLNKYNRKKLFDFIVKTGFKKPRTIYWNLQDEVFLFEKMSKLHFIHK